MKALALLVLMPCVLCACVTTEVLNSYERDELIAVQHNEQSDYTLLTYRDPLGQTRHVLRRHGVFELVITYLRSGEFELQERGCDRRVIEAGEAHHITKHINEMLQVKKAPSERFSGT